MSVARLELLAALLAASIGVFIQKTFKDKKLPMKFFSNSQINLYRFLNDPLTFQPWVANRVQQITKLTDVNDWFYIKSTQNVASDLISQGCSLSELLNSKEYWHSPAFFGDPNHNYEEMSINPNKGDVREALPGGGGLGPGAPLSFSALEPQKGQKSCFHISLDHFQLI